MRRASLIFLLLLALLSFSARTLHLSSTRLQPKFDEVGYLGISRDYARGGGVLATVECHIEGRCLEVNRHPLFQLLLVPVMDETPADFPRGKVITWLTGLLLIGVVALLARRAFDPFVAVGTAVVMALSPIFADTAAEIRHDPLFTAFACATIYLMASGFSWRRWLGLGLLAGLAYLTKGSGHLLVAAAMGVALVHYRTAVVKKPAIYVLVAGFVAVAWWLLLRNVLVYGSPFFNFNNRAAWLDQWADVWELQRSAEWSRVGLLWFVERHGWLGLAARLFQGFFITFGLLIYSAGVGFAGVAVQANEVVANLGALAPPILTGLAVVVLAVVGAVMRWREGERTLLYALAFATAIFWAALSVGALGGHDNPRYLLVLTFSWLPFAIHALVHGVVPRIARRVGATERGAATGLVLSALLALSIQLGWFRDGLASDPMTHVAVPENWAKTSRWMSEHLRPGERFALPYHSFYSTWDLPRPDLDPRWNGDFTSNPTTMARQLVADHVDTILLDTADPDYPYGGRISGEKDAEGPLTFDGWPRCYFDGGRPSRFLAFCRPGLTGDRPGSSPPDTLSSPGRAVLAP